jgi:hypothetical protein
MRDELHLESGSRLIGPDVLADALREKRPDWLRALTVIGTVLGAKGLAGDVAELMGRAGKTLSPALLSSLQGETDSILRRIRRGF